MAPSVRTEVRRAAVRVPGSVAKRLPSPLSERIARWQKEASLAPPSLDALDNVSYNRSVWNWYAEKWSDPDFRAIQLAGEGRHGDDPSSLEVLGEEWGELDDVRRVVEDWVLPHVDRSSVVGEIGTGGGRVARMVVDHVGQFNAFDIAADMLAVARRNLGEGANLHYHVLPGPELPSTLTGSMDFVYSFDVFVHLDLHVQWKYFQQIARVLRPGAKAMVHTASLTSELGWERFVGQDRYRVEGFYFMTPEAVRTLVVRAGLEVLEDSTDRSGNFYYDRDYLLLLRKP